MIYKLRLFFYFLIQKNSFIFNIMLKVQLRLLPLIVNIAAKLFQGINNIWDEDENFIYIYNQVKTEILLDKKRAYVLYKSVKHSAGISGEIAELGVYRGGGIKLISKIKSNKVIYGFDTFEGFPEFDKEKNPIWKNGLFNDFSYDRVTKYINNESVVLIKGPFPDTKSKLPKGIIFSFVHIDFDLFEGTLAACEFFYNKMAIGGLILVDDYGFLSCLGVREAVDSFFNDKPEVPLYLPSGQALIIKQ